MIVHFAVARPKLININLESLKGAKLKHCPIVISRSDVEPCADAADDTVVSAVTRPGVGRAQLTPALGLVDSLLEK